MPNQNVALGDVDGDGDLDAFVANVHNGDWYNSLDIWDDTGRDVFAARLSREIGGGARAVAVGLLDAGVFRPLQLRRQAQQAGIGMPEVAVYDAPDVNAFATGARRDSALVAVSTGLLQSMGADEVEAVLAHEVSHVANGDMITMGLLQGVVNTFVIFLSRVIGHTVDRVVFKTERGYGPAYFITSIVAQIFLSIIASTIVMWFSRRREFRADAGGADLAGRRKMIGALKALQRQSEPQDLPGEFAAFGISGGMGDGLKRLFLSHPPLQERIAALEERA